MSLKQVRERFRLSQQDIADIAGTTLKTAIAWEAGTLAVPLTNARRLQAKFQLPLSAFRKNPPSEASEQPETAEVAPQPAGRRLGARAAPPRPPNLPYGSIRLKLLDRKGKSSDRSQDKKFWYVWPITQAERESVTRLLEAGTIHSDAPDTKDWLAIETLDDRLVFVNMAAIESVELIDDDNAAMPEHESQETYELMQQMLGDLDVDDVDFSGYSQYQINQFNQVVESLGGPQHVRPHLQNVTIELLNGRRLTLPFDEEHAEDLLSSMLDNDSPAAHRFGHLSGGDDSDEVHYRFGALRLIEVSKQRWTALIRAAHKA